jgi:extracellular factor (EF) 3-hydroxypalmitic acid methyl ester biosynthesis protein
MLQSTCETENHRARPPLGALNPVPRNLLVLAADELCHRALQLILSGGAFAAFRILGPELSHLHGKAIASGCEDSLIAAIRKHPLFDLCQQDPYTARAFRKPRGFAGDAVMMDFVYSGRAPEETSHLGRQIFQATTRVPMGLSVLYRRSLLHSQINDCISRQPSCRILSVASGHCREIEGSLLFEGGFDAEFVALDQDSEAAAVLARDYAHPRLHVRTERVKALALGKVDIGQFDLIYSAGLYDYLPDTIASLLTAQLVSMLRPGGRLLIANFLHSSYGRGYLEVFMDWRLNYRSEAELIDLLPENLRPLVRITTDPHENVAYAHITRTD